MKTVRTSGSPDIDLFMDGLPADSLPFYFDRREQLELEQAKGKWPRLWGSLERKAADMSPLPGIEKKRA